MSPDSGSCSNVLHTSRSCTIGVSEDGSLSRAWETWSFVSCSCVALAFTFAVGDLTAPESCFSVAASYSAPARSTVVPAIRRGSLINDKDHSPSHWNSTL